MASIAASLLPPLFINGRKPIFSTLHKLPVPAIKVYSLTNPNSPVLYVRIVDRLINLRKHLDDDFRYGMIEKTIWLVFPQAEYELVEMFRWRFSGFKESGLNGWEIYDMVDRQNRVAVVVKATEESSESSLSLDIVKSVKNVWEDSEDRLALIGLGFAGVVALWASTNLISAVDKLPFIPSALEFVGILYSSWFIYRYLLFKPDREELFQIVNKSISNVLGQ